MKTYLVKGNVSLITVIAKNQLITVYNRRDDEQAPVLLTTIGNIADYVNELYGTDYEEKYMKKIFTYTSWCDVEKIEVIDENGEVVKTVTRDTSKEEYSKWID